MRRGYPVFLLNPTSTTLQILSSKLSTTLIFILSRFKTFYSMQPKFKYPRLEHSAMVQFKMTKK